MVKHIGERLITMSHSKNEIMEESIQSIIESADLIRIQIRTQNPKLKKVRQSAINILNDCQDLE